MRLTKRQTALVYWLATGLVALFMAKSGLAYLTQDAVRVECLRLGFPDYFRIELALAKLGGYWSYWGRWGRGSRNGPMRALLFCWCQLVLPTWPRASPCALVPGR
jgi:hypothetical protein